MAQTTQPLQSVRPHKRTPLGGERGGAAVLPLSSALQGLRCCWSVASEGSARQRALAHRASFLATLAAPRKGFFRVSSFLSLRSVPVSCPWPAASPRHRARP
jgi:hypothetical protein